MRSIALPAVTLLLGSISRLPFMQAKAHEGESATVCGIVATGECLRSWCGAMVSLGTRLQGCLLRVRRDNGSDIAAQQREAIYGANESCLGSGL